MQTTELMPLKEVAQQMGLPQKRMYQILQKSEIGKSSGRIFYCMGAHVPGAVKIKGRWFYERIKMVDFIKDVKSKGFVPGKPAWSLRDENRNQGRTREHTPKTNS